MKRIINIIFIVVLALPIASEIHAQDKKTERQARKELKRQERAIKDSLMNVMRMAKKDSVNIGYGYTDGDDVNSSVKSLKASKNDISSYSDIADYIQGRVPGVMVMKNGGTSRYVIRGIGTNSDSTDPLLLVDDVVVDSFDNILPSQVESVEVLKDAASASIYGIQGAGGVIKITTRKN
ncbi:MAG: TonB-dependent receptor plug domain-containing protein [Bacteroidales bacterium]|nr:TonB-dependent receptor plug domain-containing protein [Bacteroidales bacterium]